MKIEKQPNGGTIITGNLLELHALKCQLEAVIQKGAGLMAPVLASLPHNPPNVTVVATSTFPEGVPSYTLANSDYEFGHPDAPLPVPER